MLLQRNGRTPIMEAVLDNLMDMVKVLIYATDDRSVWASKETTQVDLSLQDKSGNSVIHLCVQNREVSGAVVNVNSGVEDFSLLKVLSCKSITGLEL